MRCTISHASMQSRYCSTKSPFPRSTHVFIFQRWKVAVHCPSANIPSFFQMHRMHAYICYLRQSHDISKSCLLFIFTVMETLACNWLPATYMHLQGNGFFMGRNHNRSILDGHIYIYRSTDHSEHYAPCFCLL